MKDNPCVTITKTDEDLLRCNAFMDSTVSKGMSVALVRYFENMK